jgi:hypothetical protein
MASLRSFPRILDFAPLSRDDKSDQKRRKESLARRRDFAIADIQITQVSRTPPEIEAEEIAAARGDLFYAFEIWRDELEWKELVRWDEQRLARIEFEKAKAESERLHAARLSEMQDRARAEIAIYGQQGWADEIDRIDQEAFANLTPENRDFIRNCQINFKDQRAKIKASGKDNVEDNSEYFNVVFNFPKVAFYCTGGPEEIYYNGIDWIIKPGMNLIPKPFYDVLQQSMIDRGVPVFQNQLVTKRMLNERRELINNAPIGSIEFAPKQLQPTQNISMPTPQLIQNVQAGLISRQEAMRQLGIDMIDSPPLPKKNPP